MTENLADKDAFLEEMAAEDIDRRFVPVKRPDITSVVLEGEAVVLADGQAQAHYLNEIATLVWDTFDGGATIDQLSEDFADVFGADIDVVREDIIGLVQGIGRAGLLVGVAHEPTLEPSFAQMGVGEGEPIPPFKLPDPAGVEVALSDFQGRPVLLVNWSPYCGFCSMIAPELAELQPELGARGIELVFITLGSPEENLPQLAEHDLTPIVLFGEGNDVAVFAGVGTPAAYLVDGEGLASSEMAVGADMVPELARATAGSQ